ncbi:MAG: VOC family protein [Balneola sp.]
MNKLNGAFRFTYFTKKYAETRTFFESNLGFSLEHSWDRNEDDKGALYKVGNGLIEILQTPNSEEHKVAGLDYRHPQGAFMCIQVWEIDQLFEKYKINGIPFKQELTNQSWGHRSFSVIEPNGLVLFFFEEQF